MQSSHLQLPHISALYIIADSTKASMSITKVLPLTSPTLTLHLHSQALSAPLPAVALSLTLSLQSICSLTMHPRYFKSNLLHSKSFHTSYASAVSLKHLNIFLSSPHCWYGGFNCGGGRPPLIGRRSGGSCSEGEEKEENGEWSTVTLQSRGQSK